MPKNRRAFYGNKHHRHKFTNSFPWCYHFYKISKCLEQLARRASYYYNFTVLPVNVVLSPSATELVSAVASITCASLPSAVTIHHCGYNMTPNNRRHIRMQCTRTGSITSKRRHIKCDEAKPQCMNCTRSNKVCLGYEQPSRHATKSNVRRELARNIDHASKQQIDIWSVPLQNEITLTA